MSQKEPAVYILASRRNGTLYVGVTADLPQRIYEHKYDLVQGFTSRYRVHTLVYYELHGSMMDAIEREKKLKNMKRWRKLQLIESENPDWRDLWNDITGYTTVPTLIEQIQLVNEIRLPESPYRERK